MMKTLLSHSSTDDRPPKQEDDEEEEAKHDKKKTTLCQLPNIIIVEIFSKFPIKAIVQCRYVCKSWRSLLSDPDFTKYIFSRTPTCILRHNSYAMSRNLTRVDMLLEDLGKAFSGNGFETKLQLNIPTHGVRIVGSCNGLLCLHNFRGDHHRFYISNPLTAESLALPILTKRRKYDNRFGFGFSPMSDAYKVVIFMCPSKGSDEGNVMVMTVGSGIWRSTGTRSLFPYGHHYNAVYLNGFIYWMGKCKNGSLLISAFDVETECFQQFPVPAPEFSYKRSGLGVFRGCLSLTVWSSEIHVWLMKDGTKEVWSKEYEITQTTIPFIRPQLLKFAEEGQFLLLPLYRFQHFVPVRVNQDNIDIPLVFDRACLHIPSIVSLKDLIKTT